VANRSYLINNSSTVPLQNDWEGHDQDEVFTGRRVATTTVKSGAPKHFSSDWAVSHSDDPIRTESNAASEKGLGLSLNCCKHGVLCSTRCEPVILRLSGYQSGHAANSQTGSHDVLSENFTHLNKVITHNPVINPAHAYVPESVKSRFKPAINEEGGVPDGNTDPYLLTSSSITHPDAFNLSSPAHDYIPLVGIVDVKPTLTNEIHADFPEPIMFMGMKIIGDSGAGETMLPYPRLFLNLTVPSHHLTVVLADGTPVPVDGIGVTIFSPTTWFVRALSVGILLQD